ncbi:MAG: Hsp20/alpha crystallin family protein [Candidatus Magasanikbacteria bacterium]|nr:Hsp20/alpha crystallin family protein [Candidatus Magasanikbacteria bacterium]
MFEPNELVSLISQIPPSIEEMVVVKAEEKPAGWEPNGAEGQLSVDVAETETELIIVATMAGTKPENIELHLHNDFLTIRGRRQSPVSASEHYFYQECFWGTFSRTIVLPVDVLGSEAQSEYARGILTIRLPKASHMRGNIPIMVVEE